MNQTDRITLGLLSVILRRVEQLHERLTIMGRTEQELKDDLAAVKTDLDTINTNVASIGQAQQTTIDALKAQVADLTAKLAAGSPVSQDDLDAIVGSADALRTQADGLVALVTPPTPAATEPPAPPTTNG